VGYPGIKQKLDDGHALRTVPSAGCRHALETYLCVLNVRGLDQGIYRYLPLEHKLLYEFTEDNLDKKNMSCCFGSKLPEDCGRYLHMDGNSLQNEWRYDIAAHKVIAIDAGHVCQNLLSRL